MTIHLIVICLQAEPDDVVLTIAVEDVNDNAPIFDEDSLTGEVSKSASAGTSNYYRLWNLRLK